ncbi:MAG: discoidin domain-containing protein [Clostridia bacterium]|nr:discoidin domain-containing protein [Clostridia bacterium]
MKKILSCLLVLLLLGQCMSMMTLAAASDLAITYTAGGSVYNKVATGADGVTQLVVAEKYTSGATVNVTLPEGEHYLGLTLHDSLGEAILYVPSGVYTYQFPTHSFSYIFSSTLISSTSNTIKARVVSETELSQRRNVALNPYDLNGAVSAYPHATASDSYNDSTFAPRNAIDGMAQNTKHGSYPYQSWGATATGGRWFQVNFQHEVYVDEVVMAIRADFPHDTYWKTATLEFSDGSKEDITVSPTAEKQSFKFDVVKTSYVKVTNLVKANPNVQWAGITEFEVYGSECEAPQRAGELKIANVSGQHGDTVTVDVAIADNPGLSTLSLTVEYDATALELTGVTDTKRISATLRLPSSYASPCAMVWVGTADTVENGTIARLTFKIKKGAAVGSSKVSVVCNESKKSNGTVNTFTNGSGKITISCKQHSYSEWITVSNATCTENGVKQAACSACGHIETRSVEAVGHEFEDPTLTKAATIYSTGLMEGKCQACGETTKQVIPCSMTDTSTGTVLETQEGVFTEGTVVSVEEITDETVKAKITDALVEITTKFKAIHVAAAQNGVAVQPNGSVKLIFAVPENFSESIALYDVSGETIQQLESLCSEDNKTVSVTVETLGSIAICDISAVPGSADEGITDDAHAPAEKNHDGVWYVIIGGIVVAAVAGAVVVTIILKKKEKTIDTQS